MEDKDLQAFQVSDSFPNESNFKWCCHVSADCIHCEECSKVISCENTYSKCSCSPCIHGEIKEDNSIHYDETKSFKWNLDENRPAPTEVLLFVSDGVKVWSALKKIEYRRKLISNKPGWARYNSPCKKITWYTDFMVENEDYEYCLDENCYGDCLDCEDDKTLTTKIHNSEYIYWSYIPIMPKCKENDATQRT